MSDKDEKLNTDIKDAQASAPDTVKSPAAAVRFSAAGMPKRTRKSRGRVTRSAGAAGDSAVPVVVDTASDTAADPVSDRQRAKSGSHAGSGKAVSRKAAGKAADTRNTRNNAAGDADTRSDTHDGSNQKNGSTGNHAQPAARGKRIQALAEEMFVDKGIAASQAEPDAHAPRAADTASPDTSSDDRGSSASTRFTGNSSDSLFSAPFSQQNTGQDTDGAALPAAKPMMSLLFQAPVLPAADSVRPRATRGGSHVTLDTINEALEEQSSRKDKSRGIGPQPHGSRNGNDGRAGRNAAAGNIRMPNARQAEEKAFSGDSDADALYGGHRSSRRLNAQERRAAAEVEQIEEDLENDEITYNPIESELEELARERRYSRRYDDGGDEEEYDSQPRRRTRSSSSRTRKGNRRGKGEDSSYPDDEGQFGSHTHSSADDYEADDEPVSTRRRRRRRRGSADQQEDERIPRSRKQQYIDKITGIEGSTRLEAKRQRRRDNRRERSRRSLITEQDFLARRENVDRLMVVRQKGRHSQVSVIEDNVLVEHYISDIEEVSSVGNIYQGRVQNVLPSMEAAFVDIGQHRNGVLYAGEVNWDATRLDGQPRLVEHAFRPGDNVLVQVTKDPIGHKGARLTAQITVAGRYLVLVPAGGITGVSRKLPERERTRLKNIVDKVAPKNMGVIIRTAAEGASEEALQRDMQHLVSQWDHVEKGLKDYESSKRPHLLQGEPDVVIRVIRDIFNDDFSKLVVEGDDVYSRIREYLESAAPDMLERLEKWDPEEHKGRDVFDKWSIDSQLRKGMERKVYLPSGGSLIVDRTEAMTTIDVNTGRFIGRGQSLEETVTKCNLEAAEEIVRQLRLRDIGGMIMIDFVDMVMPQNRDLVLRRLVECLSRDRTKHQVAEVTSLGLVQMTRKRVGQGLVEAFSEECPTCGGRGFILHDEPTVSADYDDPYALKGGDPFVHTNKHGYGRSHYDDTDSNAPKGSTPQVKATLARIAAAAAEAAESDKTASGRTDADKEHTDGAEAGTADIGTAAAGTADADTADANTADTGTVPAETASAGSGSAGSDDGGTDTTEAN